MSSIEKALERMIARKKSESEQSGFGSVEDNAVPENPVVIDSTANEAHSALNTAAVIDEDPGHSYQRQSEKRICHLDFARLEESGFLTPRTSQKRQSEEYRVIKRPILQNAFNKGAVPVKHGNLVAVTSAQTGEGKTYTAINLAISIAMELDTTILLVDGDILKASLSATIGIENEPGLMDVLKNDSLDLSDVILATDMPNFKILPAGHMQENPTELLSSGKMRDIINDLAQRYNDRIILFDAPPLLETTEAEVIIDMMGQVLMVVEAGRTGTDQVQDAVKRINADKVVGMILNKSRATRLGGYYGGYYGYDRKQEYK